MKQRRTRLLVLLTISTFLLTSLSVHGAQKRRKRKKRKVQVEQFERPYGIAGCGLGSMILGKYDGPVFAASTNALFLNQAFGITSGTLNCVDGPMDDFAGKVDHFVISNKVALASDISRGRGETIVALGEIFKCNNPNSLGQTLQKKFTQIYPSANVSYMQVTDSLINVIVKDPNISCNYL